MIGFNYYRIRRSGHFMKRSVRAIICCAVLLAGSAAAHADPTSDRDMANRYLQAARSGDDDAQFYIAALYSAGVGVPRSDEEAFRWFARAADQGHSHAMLILGGLYAIGRGAPKDNVRAYQYAYIVGSGTKVEEFRNGSRQLMGVLEGKMTSDEVSRARTEASRWRPVAATQAARSPALPAPADTSRNAYQAPPAPTAQAAPPPAANTQAPAKTSANASANSTANASANSDDGASGKTSRKNDIDGLLDQVPQGLRKKFGF
jgi:Sel1 repeat